MGGDNQWAGTVLAVQQEKKGALPPEGWAEETRTAKYRILLTFPGKLGDILWCLPAARQLAQQGTAIEFAVMPKYGAVLELMRRQEYIERAFAIPGWEEEHNWCGAQPRVPPSIPSPERYDQIIHLGYCERPNLPLYFHAFKVIGFEPRLPIRPFISPGEDVLPDPNLVAYAFAEEDLWVKQRVLSVLRGQFKGTEFYDVSKAPFHYAAQIIGAALFFLGCRSANYVVAHGLGKKILTCEPNPGRREIIFSYPWGTEAMPDPWDCQPFVSQAKMWGAH